MILGCPKHHAIRPNIKFQCCGRTASHKVKTVLRLRRLIDIHGTGNIITHLALFHTVVVQTKNEVEK